MGFDPSKSVTSCNCCGKTIEAWINICDDCIEKAYLLQTKFDKFTTKFCRLISEGEELVKDLEKIGINANQMKYYLLERMSNFRDGYEMFQFENIEEAIKEIIGGDEEE